MTLKLHIIFDDCPIHNMIFNNELANAHIYQEAGNLCRL